MSPPTRMLAKARAVLAKRTTTSTHLWTLTISTKSHHPSIQAPTVANGAAMTRSIRQYPVMMRRLAITTVIIHNQAIPDRLIFPLALISFPFFFSVSLAGTCNVCTMRHSRPIQPAGVIIFPVIDFSGHGSWRFHSWEGRVGYPAVGSIMRDSATRIGVIRFSLFLTYIWSGTFQALLRVGGCYVLFGMGLGSALSVSGFKEIGSLLSVCLWRCNINAVHH